MKNASAMDLGKFKVTDLRMLLSYLPLLEQEHSEALELAHSNSHLFEESSNSVFWCHLYELPFHEHLAQMIVAFGMAESIKSLAHSGATISNILELQTESEIESQDFIFENMSDDERRALVQSCFAWATSVKKSLQCLLIFGCYLNELIAKVRVGCDLSLFNAIKIDVSVLGCPSVITRLSKAVMLNDLAFLAQLKRAINAPLEKRSQANFQKMRFVLKVLAESDAQKLSDDELYKLFVSELKLYAKDSKKGDAKKSLGKFVRAYQRNSTT